MFFNLIIFKLILILMASCSPKGLLLKSSFMAKAGPLAGPSKELCEP